MLFTNIAQNLKTLGDLFKPSIEPGKSEPHMIFFFSLLLVLMKKFKQTGCEEVNKRQKLFYGSKQNWQRPSKLKLVLDFSF